MLRTAIGTPFRSGDAAGTLIIGSVLTFLSIALPIGWLIAVVLAPVTALFLLPVVLFPLFVLRGYTLKMIHTAANGGSAAPSFVSWGLLARNGVRSVILTLIYLTPAVILLGLGVTTAFLLSLESVSLGSVGATVTALSSGIAVFSAVLYLLIYSYVRPAAEAVFATTGRFRSALAPKPVLKTAGTGDFATGWILSVFLLSVGILFGVPLFALLVGVLGLFGIRVMVAALIGAGVQRTLGTATKSNALGQQVVSEKATAVSAPIEQTIAPLSATDTAPTEADPAVQVGRSVAAGFSMFERPTLVDPSPDNERKANTDTTPTLDDGFSWGPLPETPTEQTERSE